jgi:hypothetical protein
MLKNLTALLVAGALAFTPVVHARGGGGHSGGGHSSSHSGGHSSSGHAGHASSHSGSHAGQSAASHATHRSPGHRADYSAVARRDAHGKIVRSSHAKNDFKKQHPCPSTGKSSGACPGYVIDHVTALKRGGADAPSNMQWQTTSAAKAKDKTE